MTVETSAITLIRTKLQPPRLPADLVRRRRLVDRLQAGLDRKLTLISAQAGAGKTTLLVQWLGECPQPSAWLSLDEHDNDLIVFVSYLIVALRTAFPGACEKTLALLSAAQPPPLRVITSSLVNELDDLALAFSSEGDPSECGLILALDDYQAITELEIHKLVSALLQYLPRSVHLALATRSDPPLPLPQLRARGEMTEFRFVDLRFTPQETDAFLQGTVGREVSAETAALLAEKAEGWIVGLRLAALSTRVLSDDEAFAQRFKGTSSALIVEYLLSEVLARQSSEIQDFALRTSLLRRFCAPLCEAVTGVPAARSQEIIESVARDNLFLVPLDEKGEWYRYHHLFQDLLRHELRRQSSAADRSGLHARAGEWFVRNGFPDEAVRHFSAAEDTAAAVAVVEGRRYDLLNRAQWVRLEHYLDEFSPETVDASPELLVLKAWLLYHRGRYAELPAAVQGVEAALARATLAPGALDALQGEISTLRSYVSILALDLEGAFAHARQALAKTPRELWIVRLLARLCLAIAQLLTGDESGAYETVYASFEQEGDQSNPFKATLLVTACNIHWMTADLLGLARAAEQILALSLDPYSPTFLAWGHYNLGRAQYHHGDLAAAEEHFAAVVQHPYQSYGICYVYSACGLALVHQALGRPERAREVFETAATFTLETGNTTLLAVALAFQVELALMQGQIAVAGKLAARFDPVPSLSPMFGLFAPHLTLVKVWLAKDTSASRGRAADLLGQVQAFCESSHTTRFLIEALALGALLNDREGDEPAALDALKQAIALAEPAGFIRLFVDLGPGVVPLLSELRQQNLAPVYLDRVLAAFPTGQAGSSAAQDGASEPQPLVDPLTPREMEVLALLARHLTNRQIAEELVISPVTVKTHTLRIYRKLDVRGRQQAVARAQELDIL
ncbi:MAG: LuxR C-terminal-related transcriptional regulator [Promethearchaeota archaeon]